MHLNTTKRTLVQANSWQRLLRTLNAPNMGGYQNPLTRWPVGLPAKTDHVGGREGGEYVPFSSHWRLLILTFQGYPMDQDPYCYSQHSQLIKIKCATLHVSIISIRNRLIENYFNPKFGNQSERLHVILLYHYIFCWINTTYIHIWYLYLDIACSFYMFNRIILYIISGYYHYVSPLYISSKCYITIWKTRSIHGFWPRHSVAAEAAPPWRPAGLCCGVPRAGARGRLVIFSHSSYVEPRVF